MGARESPNGRKNIYGTKKSKERREEPLGTMSYETSSTRSPPFWLLIGARKHNGTGLVRHCPQGLFSPFFTFLRSIYIFPPVWTFPRPHYLPLGLRGWDQHNTYKFLGVFENTKQEDKQVLEAAAETTYRGYQSSGPAHCQIMQR